MSDSDPSQDHDQLTQQIRQTRDELGSAVNELAAKSDVKQRFADETGQLKAAVAGRANQFKEAVAGDSQQRLLLVLAAAFAVLAGVLLIGRRSARR